MKLNLALALFVILIFGAEIYKGAHAPQPQTSCAVSR